MRQDSKSVVDLRDPKIREQFIASEFEQANQKLIEGNMEEAIGHFINFVQFSGNPKGAIHTLQQVLPPAIFNLVIQTFAMIAKSKEKENGSISEAVEID